MNILSRFRSDPRVSRLWNRTLYQTLPVLGIPVSRRPRTPGPPRVLVDVSDQPRAGAFTALSALMDALIGQGFQVRLITGETLTSTLYEVVPIAGLRTLTRHYRWADVVLTQRARTKTSSRLAAFARRPLIYMLHDPTTDVRDELRRPPDLMIPVSEHILAAQGFPPYGMVVRPPIDPAPYRTKPGDAVTLVNLSEWKGAHVFYELARRMPDMPFLGVRGWGNQVIPDTLLENVEVVGPTDDMKSIYARTRILLAPSWSEGFPRTPLEAASSGIPVIAHPCAGLHDALGDAGIYADRDHVDAWEAALWGLGVPAAYASASAAIESRFDEVANISYCDVEHLAEWIRNQAA